MRDQERYIQRPTAKNCTRLCTSHHLRLNRSSVAFDRSDSASRRAVIDTIDHITGNLDIVILSQVSAIGQFIDSKTNSKLANLGIVNSHHFTLLRRPETEARNQIDKEENDTAPEKRVCETGNRIGKLVSELDVVVVKPAAINFG